MNDQILFNWFILISLFLSFLSNTINEYRINKIIKEINKNE